MKKLTFITLVTALLLTTLCYAQNVGDYLIMNDIGTFRNSRPQAVFEGRPPIGGPRVTQNDSGVLSGAGHFRDHADTTYKLMHIDNTKVKPSPEVIITQHVGGDSDRLLLHEIECSFRDKVGIITDGAVMLKINNNRALWIGIGGGDFRWISNNVVIHISYTDLNGIKPEPIEVVQAYLAKFPSTITTTDAEFKSTAYNVKWIKDEIDRRFWLCDKWNAQFQAGKATQKDLLYNLVSNMEVYLNYREKYFGDIKAFDEKVILYDLRKNKNVVSIQTKLSEYKNWWAANKAQSISLP